MARGVAADAGLDGGGGGPSLERDAHTIGQWVKAFAQGGPKALVFEQTGGSSRVGRRATKGVEAAVPGLPSPAGINLSNWNWKALRQLVRDRFGLTLSRSSCLNYLHRLGFVLKRPRKRLVKADPVRREAFVAEYSALGASAGRTSAKVFFADEAHFQADADLRGKWVLKGEPALVDSTSSRRGEKVSYYSAVCLGTREVEVMELEGNSNSATFLQRLRAQHPEPLIVIWDNSPAHRRDTIRAYLSTPGLHLHLVNLPSYSPDFNAPIFDQSRHLGLGAPGSDG